MKPNEIRAALVLRSITVTSIAKQLGTSQPNVSAVISGNIQTRSVQNAIAKAIDKDVEEVFPETSTKKKDADEKPNATDQVDQLPQ